MTYAMLAVVVAFTVGHLIGWVAAADFYTRERCK